MQNLDSIKTVEIDHTGGFKFILAKVTAPDRKSKLVVRARETANFHRDILFTLQRETGLTARCLGGGNILVNPASKTVELWGSSGDFGREDRQKTATLIREAMPDFTVVTR